MEKLSEISLMILDCGLNIRPSSPENLFETLSIILQKERDDLQEEWDDLVKNTFIIKKDYQWTINPSYKDEARKQIEIFLKSKNITPEQTMILLESYVTKEPAKLSILIKIIGKISDWDQSKYVGFVDYDWDNEIGYLCEEFVKNNIMFRVSTSSKKHSYRSYYFRTLPFDSTEIIRSVVLKHLNVEGLTNEEWKVLPFLFFSSDLSLDYELLKTNTDLTEAELREIITNLKERGLIEEKYSKIFIPQGLKEPLIQYFITNVYPKVKSNTINQLKRKISRSLSNLSIFMDVKRIYELPSGEIKSVPFLYKLVNKREIERYEPIFSDMRNLNIILNFKDQIMILADIVKDIENWLRSSIKESIIFIPARDIFMARGVLQEIFSKCEDYVKIQDPYVGEETFDIFEYIPQNIKISLITGTETGRDEEPDRINKRIERLKAERKANFQMTFIGDTSGVPPFHDRFIIAKNKCWQIGTSLKQIGKGKDTTISEISKREKDEMIEPAFDRWWNAKKSELEEKNLIKMNPEEWKTRTAIR